MKSSLSIIPFGIRLWTSIVRSWRSEGGKKKKKKFFWPCFHVIVTRTFSRDARRRTEELSPWRVLSHPHVQALILKQMWQAADPSSGQLQKGSRKPDWSIHLPRDQTSSPSPSQNKEKFFQNDTKNCLAVNRSASCKEPLFCCYS